MNKSLDHLPLSHQKNLEYIVNVIRDEFEQVTGFSNGKKSTAVYLKSYSLAAMPTVNG